MLRLMVLLALVGGGSAAAQDLTPQVAITGVGTVKTPPDAATLNYTVRGEGRTSDEAARELETSRAAIEDGLSAMAPIQLTTSGLSIDEDRGEDCDVDPYDGSPRLSVGDCAVQGYVATLRVNAKTSDVEGAGTMLSLAARLGAKEASVAFALQHPQIAQTAAAAQALADARQRAEAIVANSHSRVGEVLSVRDSEAASALNEIVVNGEFPKLQPRPEAPVRVSLKPEPIETTLRLWVVFRLEPRP